MLAIRVTARGLCTKPPPVSAAGLAAAAAAKAAPKTAAVAPKRRWLGWKSKLALAAGGVYVTARVLDRLLHPRPATELVEDLLLAEPGPRKER